MAETYVPLISSGTAGPLGVLHFPRLWQKVSLKARGKLAEGYPDIGGGYDTMVLTALGIEPDAVRKFISENRPAYPQFEAWVKNQNGVKLDKATIDGSNRAIRGYTHDEKTRKSILGPNNIADENSVGHGAVDLNNLDDWYEFHQAVLMTDAPKPSTDAETPASTADAATASAPASAPVATPAPAAEEQEPAPVGVS